MAENFWDTSPRKGLIQYKVDHAKFPWFYFFGPGFKNVTDLNIMA